MRTTAELLSHLNRLGIKLWDDDGYLGFSAPKGALTRSLRRELVAHKAKILELLRQKEQSALASKPVKGRQAVPSSRRSVKPPVEGRSLAFPLSHGQQALWFVYQNAPESAAYNMSLPLHIQDLLDVPVLRQVLQNLVERHPALRTIFTLPAESGTSAGKGGVTMQEVQQQYQFVLEEVDASPWTWDELMEEVRASHKRPFDLQQGPVFRGTLFTFAPQNHVLLLSMHHLTGDAASFWLLLDELLQLYAAPTRRLPPLPRSYADYVRVESDLLASSTGKRLRTYWETQLAGDIPLLNLPTDYARPATQSHNGTSYLFPLSVELTQQLKDLARSERTTLFTVLLAAYQVLLHRYTSQNDIWVGTPTAPGRSRPEFAKTVGYLVNPVVLRARFPQEAPLSFRSFLAQVRQTVLGAIEHQDYPFPLLVQALQPERDSTRSPLFQSTYVLESLPVNTEQANRKTLSTSLLEVHQLEGQTDLDFVVTEGEALACAFKYNMDLFERATIARMANHLKRLLAAIVADPAQAINKLSLLSEAERQQQLVDWNETQRTYPPEAERCIHKLFEEQVERSPEAVAVRFSSLSDSPLPLPPQNWGGLRGGRADEQLTYRQLNQRANQLAHYLMEQGVGPEMMVGLCVERSIDMVVGLLGILKAGAAYVPLDPRYPKERLAFMLEDMDASFLLTQEHLLERLRATLASREHNATVICLDRDWASISTQKADYRANPESGVSPHNLAYMIYTSGSTGQPKGVLIEHKGIGNLAQAQIEAFHVKSESRVLQFASFSFDAAISEIMMALLAGATLVLASQDDLMPGPGLIQLLQEEKITTVTLPPSALAILPADELPDLNTIISAGEACSVDIVTRWAKGRRFLNAYGPAEATVCTTIGVCTAEEYQDSHRTPSIGRPISNVQTYLLDGNQEPVPIGVPGELYIGSVGLARGYHNRPNLTRERFVKNPFLLRHASVTRRLTELREVASMAHNPSFTEGRLYKTGDLARYLPDGRIEFLGRMDHQVKIRGFRIELGEIEAMLRQPATVQEAIVIARQNQRQETELVAYVVPSQRSDASALIAQLRTHLKERLPDYMVPAAIVILDALPLTPNGKVDRRALPAPDASGTARQSFVAPRNASERVLAEIWSEALQVAPIGINDNFFDLGGHSLLATRVMANIKSQLGKELPLNSLFQAPTIRELADLLLEAPPSQPWSAVVPIQPVGEKTPFFCLPGGAAHPLYFWELARDLGPEQPFYGLQLPGATEKSKPISDMDEFVTHFLQAIRQTQPKGPYLLGGHSSGGHMALALALALQKQGETVPAVVVLDSIAPGMSLPDQPAPDQIADPLIQMVLVAKDALGDKFPVSLARLRRLKGDAAWNYALNAYKKAKLVPPQAKVAHLKRMNQVYVGVGKALESFAPQDTYQGQLLFFQTSAVKIEHPEQIVAGWQALCANRIEVHPVPGNHQTMLNAPHVQVLAQKLREGFERASHCDEDLKS